MSISLKTKWIKTGLSLGFLITIMGTAHAQEMVPKGASGKLPQIVTKRLEVEYMWPRADDTVTSDLFQSYKPGVSLTFNHEMNPKSADLASVVRCLDDNCVGQVPVVTDNRITSNTLLMTFTQPLETAHYRVTVPSGVSDIDGNQLGEPLTWTYLMISAYPPVEKAPKDPVANAQPGDAVAPDAPVKSGATDDSVQTKDPVLKIAENIPANGADATDANRGGASASMSGAGCSLATVGAGDFDFLPMALLFGFSFFSLKRKHR